MNGPLLLLDTCAAIWISAGQKVRSAAAAAMQAAAEAGKPSYVSPISAWEVGSLGSRGRLALVRDPQVWFDSVSRSNGIEVAELSPAILIASSFLPGRPPRDPADRIVIATARALGLAVVTRDRLILGYAEQGHVLAIPC